MIFFFHSHTVHLLFYFIKKILIHILYTFYVISCRGTWPCFSLSHAVQSKDHTAAPMCLTRAGEVGVCMFLKTCLDYQGVLAGTCAKSFFLASCCLLPNANSTPTTNDPRPNPFEQQIMQQIQNSKDASASTAWNAETSSTKSFYKGYTAVIFFLYNFLCFRFFSDVLSTNYPIVSDF